MPDYIYLKNLHFSTRFGPDAWGRPKPQPVVVSIRLDYDISNAAESDDVEQTISYSKIAKDVLTTVQIEEIEGIHSAPSFHRLLREVWTQKAWGGDELSIETVLPKGLRHTDGGYCHRTVWSKRDGLVSEAGLINGLRLPCIIGVNRHEREGTQDVVVNMKITEVERSYVDDEVAGSSKHWQALVHDVSSMIKQSSFQTVESLAHAIASRANDYRVSQITVQVEKPSAMASVDGCGVEITRKFHGEGPSGSTPGGQ